MYSMKEFNAAEALIIMNKDLYKSRKDFYKALAEKYEGNNSFAAPLQHTEGYGYGINDCYHEFNWDGAIRDAQGRKSRKTVYSKGVHYIDESKKPRRSSRLKNKPLVKYC